MALDLSAYDAVLKDFYVEKIPELVNNKVKIKEHFESMSGMDMAADGRNVVYPLHISRNSGVGAVGENANLPTAGSQGYVSMTVPFRYNYGRIQISAQAIKQSRTSKGAFKKAVDQEIRGAAIDVGRDINRQLWGYGQGILCLVNGAVTASTTVPVDSPGGFAYTTHGARFLKVGDIVAFTDGSTISAVRTITAIASNLQSITVDSAVTLADNLYVVKAATTSSTSLNDTGYGKEVMGIPGMIDDGTYVATYFGNSRASYELLKAYANNIGGALLLEDLQIAFDVADQRGNGNITSLWGHHSARKVYLDLLTSIRTYNDEKALKPDGGFKGAGADITYAEVPFKVDRDCPFGFIYGLDDNFAFNYFATKGEWADDDGKILQRVSGVDAYEARFRIFDNYVHDKPNACFVLSGITVSPAVVQAL